MFLLIAAGLLLAGLLLIASAQKGQTISEYLKGAMR